MTLSVIADCATIIRVSIDLIIAMVWLIKKVSRLFAADDSQGFGA